MNIRKIIGLALVVVPSPSLASNWQLTGESVSGALLYVDVESIKIVQDGYSTTVRKAWLKFNHAAEKSVAYRERLALFYFKCDEEQSKRISSTTYKADGTVIDAITAPYPTYTPVVPDSILSGAMKVVCAKV